MLTLTIGNKNYSSWSLRPWLVLRHFEIPFFEQRLPLQTPEFAAKIGSVSPSRLVPVLHDGSVTIWDSLSIVEYLAERFPDRAIWPRSDRARWVARSACAEFHSGFFHLRNAMPMNCRARDRRASRSPALDAELERVRSIWAQCRGVAGSRGPWLFGEFSAVDAYFAPVAFRFQTYGIELSGTDQRYAQGLLSHPAVVAWDVEARAEVETLPNAEVGQPRGDAPTAVLSNEGGSR